MSEFCVKNQKEGWIIQLRAVIFGILLLTLCNTHYSHQRQYEKKNNFRCCADSHSLHISSPPIVFTSHMTWTFPTNTLCNLGNMAFGQCVSIYRYKGELSKSKNANWPQILNILNTHRMAKVEKYHADRENNIEKLLQAK